MDISKSNAVCRSGIIAAAAAAVILGSSAASAAPISWGNTATDFNAGGNWVGLVAPGTLDNATFDAVTPTFQPDVSAALTIQGLTFSTATGGWTLSSANSSLLTLTNTGTTTSSAINATNTTGTNSVSSGLVLGGAAGTTATFTQVRAGALVLSGPITSTNAITGVSLNSTGTGNATFTLSGNNSYAGNTVFGTGNNVLNINHASAISSGTLVFSNGGTIDNTSATTSLVLTNNNNINLSGGSLTYAGSAAKNLSFGSGVVTISTANRTATVTAGTLTVGSIDADLTTRTFTKTGAGTLVITGAAASNFQGGMILNGANGVLLIGNKSSLGSGNFTATTGVLQASVDLSGANKLLNTTLLTGMTVSGSNNIELGGKLTGSSGGSRTLTSSIVGNTLTLNDVDLTADTGATVRTLTIGGTGNTTIKGVIANGTGTTVNHILAVTNTGTTTLEGQNTYGGGTTLNTVAATIAMGASSTPSGVGSTVTSGPLGTGNFNWTQGAIKAVGGTRTIANPIIGGNANKVIAAGDDLVLNGSIAWGGTNTLTVNNHTTFGGAFSLRGDGQVAQRTLTVDGSGTTTMNGQIVNGSSYNGIVVLNGAGTTNLNADNSYSGVTTIGTGRTVVLGHANGLGFGAASAVAGNTTVAAGATLDLNGQTTIQESISISGTGVGGAGALINNNTSSTAVIGNGVAAFNLTANGNAYSTAPTVTLTNAGSATVSALMGLSTLSLGLSTNGSTYTTAPTITITGGGGTGALATVNNAGAVTILNPGTGYTSAPTVVLSGGAGLVGPGFTVSPTATNFTVGALQVTSAGTGALFNPTIAFSDAGGAAATVSVSGVNLSDTVAGGNAIGGAGNITIHGFVNGSAANPMTKVGAGTLNLTNANPYIGGTTITAGTLLANNVSGSATGSGAVAIAAGTLGGDGFVTGAVTVGNASGAAADAILSPGNSIGSLDVGNLTFYDDGKYLVELDATSVTSDITNVNGTLALGAGIADLQVNLTGLLAGSQKYWIINAVSGTGLDTFAGLSQDALVLSNNGQDLRISYTGDFGSGNLTGGNDVVLYTAVPEPTTLAVLAMGAGVMLRRRRVA